MFPALSREIGEITGTIAFALADADDAQVNVIDDAHKTEVPPLHHHAGCGEQITVHAADAKTVNACRLQRIHQPLVNIAGQHHLDRAHGLGIGHAHAFNECVLLLEQVELAGNVHATAVDDHQKAIRGNRRDAEREIGKKTCGVEGRATHFDTHGFHREKSFLQQAGRFRKPNHNVHVQNRLAARVFCMVVERRYRNHGLIDINGFPRDQKNIVVQAFYKGKYGAQFFCLHTNERTQNRLI